MEKIKDCKATPVRVTFNKTRIKIDGHVGNVIISQGSDELVLTPEQAISLAKELTSRFSE